MSAYRDKRNGKWRYRKRVTLPSGRCKRIEGTPAVNTRKAAEAAERNHIAKVMNRSAKPKPPTERKESYSVKAYSQIWLKNACADNKPSAIKAKKQILKAYVLPWFGTVVLGSLRQVDVDEFRAAMMEGRSRKTVANILAVLSSITKYAARNGIAVSRMSFSIRLDDVELIPVTREDIDTLCAGVDVRLRAAVLLAADAGLRVGEIRGLRWGDINELHREIGVIRAIDPANNLTPTKNRKHRTVPITDQLWDALQQVPKIGQSVIAKQSGAALGYYQLRDLIIDGYNQAEVQIPPSPWHCLRHSFCTDLSEKGVPIDVIQELAGHESLETTRRYMHVNRDRKRAAIHALRRQVGDRRATAYAPK